MDKLHQRTINFQSKILQQNVDTDQSSEGLGSETSMPESESFTKPHKINERSESFNEQLVVHDLSKVSLFYFFSFIVNGNFLGAK